MAGDTQDPAPQSPETRGSDQTTFQDPSQTKKPKYETKTQVGKLWEAFGNSDEPANALAGVNSRDRDTKDISVSEVIKGLTFDNVKTFYKTPCARDSLLTGIGIGFGAGGLRSLLGGTRSLPIAANWAVGSFAAASIATYEFCQRRRRKELDGMKQAVDLMKEVKLKKQREKEQQAAEDAARRAEEEKKRKSWTNLSNYKFW